MTATMSLAHCTDIPSLRSAIQAQCLPFGPVSRMQILAAADHKARQVVCFFRLAAPEQEQRMMTQLGVQRFGNELFMVLDLAN
jgi:hypothetical protein